MEHKNPWITKSEKAIYENPWISLTEFQVVQPGGKDGIYGVVHFKNTAVGIIPLDDVYNTWIVGQYRYTMKKYSWEIPEGGGKIDQDPLEAAKRELHEETGIKANNWREVLKVELSNSVTDEIGIVYVAKDLTFHEPEPDEGEEIVIRKLPFSELVDMTLRGEIRDCLAVTAILKVKLMMDAGSV